MCDNRFFCRFRDRKFLNFRITGFIRCKKDMRLASTCVTILLTISQQEVLTFHISGSTKHKKVLKTGKG